MLLPCNVSDRPCSACIDCNDVHGAGVVCTDAVYTCLEWRLSSRLVPEEACPAMSQTQHPTGVAMDFSATAHGGTSKDGSLTARQAGPRLRR